MTSLIEELTDEMVRQEADDECDTAYTADLLRRAIGEIRELRQALEPFAALGRTIVPNWPGQCRLRTDTRRDGSEYHSYHGESETHLGILPTLQEWRQAAEAVEKGGDNEDTKREDTKHEKGTKHKGTKHEGDEHDSQGNCQAAEDFGRSFLPGADSK